MPPCLSTNNLNEGREPDLFLPMNKDHEMQRKKLWCDVYVAYVSADNSTLSDGGKSWADRALKAFDERFPQPKADE